jgi:VWFA-related protein
MIAGTVPGMCVTTGRFVSRLARSKAFAIASVPATLAWGWSFIAPDPPARYQAQQRPVFRTGVDLVTIDVTVVDGTGRPVRELAPGDFIVTLEGQRRPVQALDFLQFGATSGTNATTPAQTTHGLDSRGGRVIVLLVDDLSIKPGEAKGLMVSAERMLSSLDLGDLVGLASTSGLGPVINPTRDRAAVLGALRSRPILGRREDVTAPFYVTVPEAFDILHRRRGAGTPVTRECAILLPGNSGQCRDLVEAAGRRLAASTMHRTAMQLSAYTEVINALRPAPVPRIIIALSKGLATGPDLGYDPLDAVGRAAAEVGVQFYSMTEETDPTDVADPGEGCPPPCMGRPAARRHEGDFLTSGLQTLAAAVGGEAFKVVGQADRFFARILSETSAVYRLGVEAPRLAEQRRLLNVKVSVNRKDVTVRANRRAVLPTVAPDPVRVDDALRTRIAQGGVAFGVPIAFGTSLRRDQGSDRLQLGVNVEVPANVTAPLTVMFAVIDTRGHTIQAGRHVVAEAPKSSPYRVAFPVPLAPGDYRIRFAVADAHGSIGSVEHPVAARLTRLATLSASDLLMGWTDAAGQPRFLALETLPAEATKLRASIELYPDLGLPESSVDVRFALLRAGSETPLEERVVTPAASGQLGTAAIEMTAAPLAPGTYVIRAAIVEAGRILGTLSATFTKAG